MPKRVASSAVEHPAFNRLVLSSNLRRPIPNEQLSSSDLPQRIFFSLLETIDIDSSSGLNGLLRFLCRDPVVGIARRSVLTGRRRKVLDVMLNS